MERLEERISERRVGRFPLGSGPVVPIGTLRHDGPVTTEQVSLYLPVLDALDDSTPATLEYKQATSGVWLQGHPLHRIRPAYASVSVDDAYAGMVFDLLPGMVYDFRITVMTEQRTLSIATRTLPANAGPTTITIPSGSTQSFIETTINAASPGDVIELQNGLYNVDQFAIGVIGNESQPVYIRGESQAGVVIRDVSDRVVTLLNCADLVIENLTVQGSGVDAGTGAKNSGITFFNGSYTQRRVTLRNLVITGVDQGVLAWQNTEQLLIYDCTILGNNVWNQSNLESGLTWLDDGIRIPGRGNAAFNNTLSGFGDTLSADVSPTSVGSVGIHFFRNEISNSCDDAFEVDDAVRNISYYDNRIHNSMTFCSMDPIVSGPAFIFRNISINTGRAPYKLNSTNTGHFFYNNTVVRTNGYSSGEDWGWNQFHNNAPQRAWGYRNNILIYQGTGDLFAMQAPGQDPIDFTHNAWYPAGRVFWDETGYNDDLGAAYLALSATTPVFSDQTQRHEAYVVSEADPFATNITLGASYLPEVTDRYVPILDSGSVLKSAGIAIDGITDGYLGITPDVGAMIEGRPIPAWGDRNKTTLSLVVNALAPGEWARLADHGITMHYSLHYWSDSACWDPGREKVIWWGAGGFCCGDMRYQMTRYDEPSDSWRMDYTGITDIGHAYDGNAFDIAAGIHYFSLADSNIVHSWDGQNFGTFADNLPITGTSPGMAYFPELNSGQGGLVWTGDNGALYYHNGTSWVQINGGQSWSGIHQFIEYNPVHKVVIFGRGSALYKMDASLTVTQLGSPPASLGIGDSKCVADYVSGKYIVYYLPSGAWYEYSVDTDSWLNITGAMTGDVPAAHLQYVLVSIPPHDATPGCVLQWNQNQRVYVYRHA